MLRGGAIVAQDAHNVLVKGANPFLATKFLEVRVYTTKETCQWLRINDTLISLDKVLFIHQSSFDPKKSVVVFDKETQTYVDASIDEIFKLLEC